MMYFANFSRRATVFALVAILVASCGGGGGSAPVQTVSPGTPIPTIRPVPPAVSNVIPITVDAGPAGTGYNVNRLYADVTICLPGSTTQCQTIDHVLVDTGSMGLRLLSSAIAPALKLNRLTGNSGLPLLNCAQFVDNTFAWGPVVAVDIVLGGKSAANVPIQVMADPAFNNPAVACSAGATMLDSAASLGANGIIGLGLFKEDCGSLCAAVAANGVYYTCTDETCVSAMGATASHARQLKNPVPLFAADNNGLLIDLPGVDSAGAPSLSGSLIFGICTQSNNQWVSGPVLTANSSGYVTTLLAGQTLSSSFFDTGSNGLFFDSRTFPVCTESAVSGFYCPDALTTLSATLVGVNGSNIAVSFSVGNASALSAGAANAVLPNLAGPIGDARTFDWGLPFFYGRRVLIGIEGQASAIGTGPFYAF